MNPLQLSLSRFEPLRTPTREGHPRGGGWPPCCPFESFESFDADSNDSSAGYPAPMDAGYVGMLRLVAGVDPDRWARRHGLEPWSCPCERCGTVLTTTVPFAWGCWRGLVAPLCACGHTRPPFCVSWSSLG